MDLTGIIWRKSKRSNGSGGDCVEVADLPDGTCAVRDSKQPTSPALTVTVAEANGHRSRVVRVHHRAACRRVRLLTEGTERPPPAPPGWGRSPSSWTDHPGQVAGPVDTGGRESRRRTTAARRDSRQPPSVARRELRRSSACTSRFSRPADLRVDLGKSRSRLQGNRWSGATFFLITDSRQIGHRGRMTPRSRTPSCQPSEDAPFRRTDPLPHRGGSAVYLGPAPRPVAGDRRRIRLRPGRLWRGRACHELIWSLSRVLAAPGSNGPLCP
jgi:uncharacterized protein DUF397